MSAIAATVVGAIAQVDLDVLICHCRSRIALVSNSR